jgi:hypothetical protein
LFWVKGTDEIPFYVGQTNRIWGRLDDYYWATFSASTDFRVGEAVRQLSRSGYRVILRYKSTPDPRVDEASIISELTREGRKLLNNDQGFDHRTADESAERKRVQEFLRTALGER